MNVTPTFERVWWVEPAGKKPYATVADSGEQAAEAHRRGWPEDGVPAVSEGDWDAVADIVGRGFGPIVDTVEWESYVPTEANEAGYEYLRVKRVKTVREVRDELAGYLSYREQGNGYSSWSVWMDGIEEGLDIFPPFNDGQAPWPHEARIVVFSVRGGSEGDYVHVEAVDGTKATLLLLAKTFMGRDAAWAAARRIADLLGA